MEKNEILKFFLEKGSQIEPSALDFLYEHPELLDKIINSNVQFPSIVTNSFVSQLLTDSKPPISEHPAKLPEQISIEDIVRLYNRRYQILRNMMSNRFELVNLLSINKLSDKTAKFSIIGIVHELADKSILLEDTTGMLKITIDKSLSQTLVEDEVIGAICERKDLDIFVRQVVHPDIPLRKEINKTKSDNFCFFVYGRNIKETTYSKLLTWLNEQMKLNIFVLEDRDSNLRKINFTQHNIFSLENDLAIFEIENIRILISNGNFLDFYIKRFNQQPHSVIIELLKKRHLHPTDNTITDPYLLEEVPDIIAINHTQKPNSINYKGTTIVFTAEPIYWLINLKTRETFKIDFS